LGVTNKQIKQINKIFDNRNAVELAFAISIPQIPVCDRTAKRANHKKIILTGFLYVPYVNFDSKEKQIPI
jgi:transposase